MSIKEKLKDSLFVRRVYHFPNYFKWKRELRKENAEIEKRAQGIVSKEFEPLLSLRNKYSGQACFIVATGPSLTFNDLKLIKNTHLKSFGMNSICRVFEDTDWRPDFYGIQDMCVFEKMNSCIKSRRDELGIVFTTPEIQNISPINGAVLFPFNYLYHKYDYECKRIFYSRFSSNAYSTVFDGFTITFSLIQIAFFLGFRTVYLLGCDCNYDTPKTHFIESGYIDKNAWMNYDKMMTAYRAAKEFCDYNDFKIYNCTRGGKLEIFERKELEEVVACYVEKK